MIVVVVMGMIVIKAVIAASVLLLELEVEEHRLGNEHHRNLHTGRE